MSGVFETLVQPLLRRLDPETAHRLAIGAMRLAPVQRAVVNDPRLEVAAFGLTFPNPLGVAAGFDKNAQRPDAVIRWMGCGFAEVGTLTPRPQPGNPRPRVFRLPRDGALINRYGFNNDGHAMAHARLLARRERGGIVGVNIGANKDTADRAADYVEGIKAFAELASYFTINVSSPNTPGLRDLQGAAALDELLARVMEARDREGLRHGRRPVLLKIAPDLDEHALDDLVRVARARTLDGMIISNTTVTRPPGLARGAEAREAGGLSGRPLFDASTRVLAQAFVRIERQFPLVGAGGIEDAETAFAKITAGATLLQLYTALVYKGPQLIGTLKRGLLAHLARERAPLVALVGRDAGHFAGASSGR